LAAIVFHHSRGFSRLDYLYRHLIGIASVCQKIFCLYNSGMEKQGRGRPAKADDERREVRFQIRLSQAELAQIENAGGEKPSTWARETLLKAAKRGARRD
jgi:hypothetical protein